MALTVSLVLLLIALPAFVRLRPHQLPANLLYFWWAPSWIGQAFAAPGAIGAALLAIVVEGTWSRLILAAAAVLFGLVHWRHRRDGKAMIRATGCNERLPVTAGLWPFNVRSGTVRIRGIAYGPEGDANKLDILTAAQKPPTPMPVLLHVPGGAWIYGTRDQQAKPLLQHMARQGWLCLDISYRLGPKHRFPAMLIDVLRAIAWAKANVAQYGGDPARIAVTGGSAGGHLTALVALQHDEPAAKPGFETSDCRVAAAVPAYGRYDFIDRLGFWRRNHEAIRVFHAENVMATDADARLWDLASPIAAVRGDAPPMLVIHGRHDSLLHCEEAEAFVAAQRQAGGDASYLELSGGQHAYDWLHSAATAGHVRAISAWLSRKV